MTNDNETTATVDTPETKKEQIADLRDLLGKMKNRDRDLTALVRAATDELINTMAEARAYGLVVNIGLDNGEQSGKPELLMFRVHKVIEEFQKQQPQPQQIGR